MVIIHPERKYTNIHLRESQSVLSRSIFVLAHVYAAVGKPKREVASTTQRVLLQELQGLKERMDKQEEVSNDFNELFFHPLCIRHLYVKAAQILHQHLQADDPTAVYANSPDSMRAIGDEAAAHQIDQKKVAAAVRARASKPEGARLASIFAFVYNCEPWDG